MSSDTQPSSSRDDGVNALSGGGDIETGKSTKNSSGSSLVGAPPVPLLGRDLRTDLDALDSMVVSSLVGSNASSGRGSRNAENGLVGESMAEQIESQVKPN